MKLRTAAVAASVLGLVAGPLLTTIGAGAGPVAVSKVVVLNDPDYTDTTQENPNLIDDLEAGGHTVTTIDVLSPESLEEALAEAEVFVVPELAGGSDRGSVAGAAINDEAEAAIIEAFVDGGGRILFFGSDTDVSTINDIFGWDLSDDVPDWCGDETSEEEPFDDLSAESVGPAASSGDCELTPEAADTEMADGPTPLTAVNDTTSLDPGSLPSGSTILYGGAYITDGVQPVAAVAVAGVTAMPYGDGVVLFLGWDWYPDTEGGAEAASAEDEADWATVLDLAVSQPEVTATVNEDESVTFTSDSPSTQPVFVSYVVNGEEQILTIAPKTTTVVADPPAGEVESASFSVPGWGIGEGEVAVGGVSQGPTPAPAQPVPADPSFTG